MSDTKVRLLAKTLKHEDGCWNFYGARNSDGYGNFKIGDRTLSAHRVAYELFVEPIPDGMCVLHSCDNRACINPKHLFLGSQIDNIRDMIRKGRSNFRSGATITLDEAAELRRLRKSGMTINEICAAAGLKYSVVWRACNVTHGGNQK